MTIPMPTVQSCIHRTLAESEGGLRSRGATTSCNRMELKARK